MPKPMRHPGKGKRVRVDFSGVDTSGGIDIPDGSYKLAVESIEEKESQDGNPYLLWIYKVAEGPCKGGRVYDNTSLQPQALWRLAKLLRALGETDLDGVADLELGSYVGRTVDVEIVNETYQGKRKPRVTDFVVNATVEGDDDEDHDADEDEEENEEEEAPLPVTKKSVKKKASAPALRVGSKVQFDDDEGDTQKGVLTEIDGETAKIDVKGEDWEVELSEVRPA